MKKRKNIKKKIRLHKKPIFIGLIIFGVVLLSLGTYILITNKNNVEPNIENKKPPKKEEPPVTVVDLNSKTRPRAVMINNIYLARPYQSGLNDAYLTYEIIVEGGITRMLALFKDKETKRIGSVRSARHYYIDYALENDAIYVHFGGSPQAFADISNLGISTVNDNHYFYWREALPISSEHTAFTNMENINKVVKSKGLRDELKTDMLLNYQVKDVKFDEEEQKLANDVSIQYSTSHTTGYKYNEETKLYERYVNNVLHKDYISGLAFTAKNIIVYQVQNVAHHTGGGRQDLKNIGSGTGYYITNGLSVPITWEKTSRSSKTIYKFTNGKELRVNDGNTYIQIQPKGMNLSIS